MSPEQFRHWGRQVVDWVADYMEGVELLPVRSRVSPGDIRRQLPTSAPQEGESFDAVLADLQDILLPGITHWQSPNFFAYFPANASGPAILGDLLSAGLGVQGMLWETSPACTELETHVMDWLVEMLGLPGSFRSDSEGGGVIQDTASSAVLCAVIAARERASGFRTDREGCAQQSSVQIKPTAEEAAGPLVAYTSSQAHSSVEKAVRIAGLGAEKLRLVEVDEQFAMDPDALEAAIRADRVAGRRPFFVAATLGTTSSHAMDPVARIGTICGKHGLWLHVDAAMAGTAALCEELRGFQTGLEGADSYCFNPHKWMFTNFDCSCFWVRDRAALVSALSVLPEYLRNQATESGAVIDYRDWQIPLGRRFRALKLWCVIRHYGVAGLQYHVRRHVALAQALKRDIEAHADFELCAPAPLNLLCFRYKANDDFNQRLMESLNQSGRIFLTHTRLNDRFVLRLSVGQTHTDEAHVKAAWDRIQRTAAELIEEQ